LGLDEILPRELGVAGLGRGGGEVVAQGVGVVPAQKGWDVHGGAAALAELATPEVEVLMVTMHKFLSP